MRSRAALSKNDGDGRENPRALPPVSTPERFSQSIVDFAREDYTLLDERLSIQEALDTIRQQDIGERIEYFYTVDAAGKLTGVLPTRRLLTAPAGQPLSEVIVNRVVSIPATATFQEACEAFVLHKLLAFPVVDAERRVVGVVDVSLLTQELLDADPAPAPVPAVTSAPRHTDEIFELLGFQLAQLRVAASPWRAFRLRFPWLLTTITSGTICALLAGAYQTTLARSLVPGVFHDDGARPQREREHPGHVGDDPGVARGDPLVAVVFRDLAAGAGFGAAVVGGLRGDGGRRRGDLAARAAGGGGDRCEHFPLARGFDSLRRDRADVVARARARPEDRRRPGDAGAGGRVRPVVLLQSRAGRAVTCRHRAMPRISSQPMVSVVIPCLNEEEPIADVVKECLATGIPREVLVVDNGSTDRTAERAAAAGARVVSQPTRGYGRACAAGVAAADPACEILLFLDGDGSDVPALMDRLIAPVADGTQDFVIGSRTRGEREPGSMNAQQVFAGHLAGFLMRTLYGVKYTDMCPFRAIRRDTLARLGMEEMTYGWNLEMQMKAAKAKLRVLEIPVAHRCRTGGVSKVSGTLRGTFVAGWKIVTTFLRIARGTAQGRR